MPQLGGEQQATPGHTKSTGAFASGEQYDLPLLRDSVLLHGLGRQAEGTVLLEHRAPKDKFPPWIQLRH